MVELLTLQAVSYIMGSVGVFVAAVYYVMNVQNNKRNQELMLKAQQQTLETRQSQLMMQLFDYFMEGGIRLTAMEMLSEKWSWNDFDDFMKKYGPERNSEAWRQFERHFLFWSIQGILVRDGIISAETLFSWWGWIPRSLWEKYEPILDEYRRRYELGTKGMMFEDWEDLYYAMLEVQVKYNKDFLDRSLPRRADKRKALGLKPFRPYT
jgi:hypothetical protein